MFDRRRWEEASLSRGVWKVVGHHRCGDVFSVGAEFGEAGDLDADLSEGRERNGFGCDWGEFGGEWDERLGGRKRAVYGEAEGGDVHGLSEYQ